MVQRRQLKLIRHRGVAEFQANYTVQESSKYFRGIIERSNYISCVTAGERKPMAAR